MCDSCDTQNDDIRDKTDHGNGQPEYGQQYINDSLAGTGDGVDATVTVGPSDPSAAVAATKGGGSTALSATLGVGIKEYMNVPWMPLVDIDTEPTGNSLDPSSDRREQSGRGFTNAGAGRAGHGGGGGGGNRTTAARPADPPAPEDDQFPYDEVVKSNGTAADDIREPVLRPKSRIRMYRMPDGSEAPAAAASNGAPTLLQQLPSSSSPLVNGSSASPSTAAVERSFIVHLLPQRLMNIIEQAERYARMAFSPFMSTTKERAQRALKNFPRSVLTDQLWV